MTEPTFKPYEGSEPYIFVSYSHKDSEQVFPILQKLYERGLRIWYDEGIDPGSEWPEEIANHLLNCGLFLLFMSPDAAESHNVRREITMAIDRKKPLINIFIKETQLKPGLQLQLNLIQHVSYARGKESFEEFIGRLTGIILRKTPDIKTQDMELPEIEEHNAATEAPPTPKMPEAKPAQPIPIKLLLPFYIGLFVVIVFVIAFTMRQPKQAPNIETGGNAAEQKLAQVEPAPGEPETKPAPKEPDIKPTNAAAGAINLYSCNTDISDMIVKYKALYPNWAYIINETVINDDSNAYQAALDQALAAGGPQAPDIYAVEAGYAVKYTQGDASAYAACYKDLGIFIDTEIERAKIQKYATEVGTRDGEIVALPYQGTGGAFIYRRSIAKVVWGTDYPSAVQNKIGPGWDKFFAAAAELKAKGYAIVSDVSDIWIPIENSAEQAWIVNGKLVIDPKREEFLDFSKQLYVNGYSKITGQWNAAWYADMRGEGPEPAFGFFGPAWFIKYVMVDNSGGDISKGGTYGDWAVCEPTVGFFWGGSWVVANKNTQAKDGVRDLIYWMTLDTSDTGAQYAWANGGFTGKGDTAASMAVMENLNGSLAFLGNQDMFLVFDRAGNMAKGGNKTQYDNEIGNIWCGYTYEYVNGYKTRDSAIADFKKTIADRFGVLADY